MMASLCSHVYRKIFERKTNMRIVKVSMLFDQKNATATATAPCPENGRDNQKRDSDARSLQEFVDGEKIMKLNDYTMIGNVERKRPSSTGLIPLLAKQDDVMAHGARNDEIQVFGKNRLHRFFRDS